MTKLIKKEIMEYVNGKKIKVVLIIDEASLLRLEVLAELHTMCQFQKDSKTWLPLIIAGQSSLLWHHVLLLEATLKVLTDRVWKST